MEVVLTFQVIVTLERSSKQNSNSLREGRGIVLLGTFPSACISDLLPPIANPQRVIEGSPEMEHVHILKSWKAKGEVKLCLD